MIDWSSLKLSARLRVSLADGTHEDFVRERFPVELPEPLPSGNQVFWGPNALGAFPIDQQPDPLDLLYPVSVEVGRLDLDDETLMGLTPGAVFSLSKPYPSTFDVVLGGQVIARASALLKDDAFVAVITEVLDSPIPPMSASPEAPTGVAIILGRAILGGRDLAALAADQVFPLDTRAAQPLQAEIEGQPFAKVEILIIDNTFHVRVRELLALGRAIEEKKEGPTSDEIRESIRTAIEETLETIDSNDSRPVDPALRREMEELFDESPGPEPESPHSYSPENRARATWVQLQLEGKKTRLAASLVAALPSEDAVAVLRLLGEADSGRLVTALASGLLTPGEALDRFAEWRAKNPLMHRGIDDAKTLLVSAFGASKAIDLINRATSQLGTEAFRNLTLIPPSRLAALLGSEHPQTVAMVLAHLEPAQAAAVLENLEPILQPDVIERLAHLRPVRAGFRRDVERTLEKRLLGGLFGDAEPDPVGGIAAAVRLLSEVSPIGHRMIIEILEEEAPELAAQLGRSSSPPSKKVDRPENEIPTNCDD